MRSRSPRRFISYYLFWYEHNYIEKGLEDGNSIVHELKFCKRYIDDLFAPNISDRAREAICNDIYPISLDIIPTNSSNLSATFLDLDVSISYRRFNWKLYDKRRDFPFKVLTMPNLRSNIPRKPAYGIFVGELFRICKSSSSSLHFKEDVKSLCDKLIKQLYVKMILMKELKRFI